MKRLIMFATIASLAALAGCSSNNNKGGSSVGYQNPGVMGVGAQQCGQIGCVSDPNLQTNIQSIFGSSASIGQVPSSPSGNMGVFFAGQVQTSTPVLQGGGQATGGMLQFQVNDSYVGQIGNNGQPIQPIVVGMQFAQGTVSPSGTDLYFADSQGYFELRGTYNNQVFQGQIYYGAGTGSGFPVGSFQIATCAFFRCQ